MNKPKCGCSSEKLLDDLRRYQLNEKQLQKLDWTLKRIVMYCSNRRASRGRKRLLLLPLSRRQRRAGVCSGSPQLEPRQLLSSFHRLDVRFYIHA